MANVFITGKNGPIQLAEKKDIIAPNLLTGTADFSGNNWKKAGDAITVSTSSKLDPSGNKTVNQDWSWGGFKQYTRLNKGDIVTFGAWICSDGSNNFLIDMYADGIAEIIKKTFNGNKVNAKSPLLQSFTQKLPWSWITTTFLANETNDNFSFRVETNGAPNTYIGSYTLVKSDTCSFWRPAIKDLAMQSDVSKLQQEIDQLKSKLGEKTS
ncbi:hypothetical protein [Lactobacillus crispatus]|uniref:hypothetical protein n=1 Tax=Lactobacillus crispatus TaxID=47770 RepID=UPI00105F598E|nr:hypothetical protein [Lactobacillus crispatus]TDM88299.1 hypothetical protein CEE95_04645 [Lactobacillus crispatus]TDM96602.1 hypothetical protein CEE89_04550 [Lactobacillus crispatus]TDN28365.1 hypothetical protein CEE74_13840 [Lactobacillus crispatus]